MATGETFEVRQKKRKALVDAILRAVVVCHQGQYSSAMTPDRVAKLRVNMMAWDTRQIERVARIWGKRWNGRRVVNFKRKG